MSELHLVRLPVDARHLYDFARRSKALARDMDEGYAVHALLAALFDHGADPDARLAPKPFAVGDPQRSTLDVLGYCKVSHERLTERAEQFADPLAWRACQMSDIVSRPMPGEFASGTRLGFTARVCPTRRVKSVNGAPVDQAEVDAFLARTTTAGPEGNLDRETVYREWLAKELGRDGGATLEGAAMTQFRLRRLLRRTQGDARVARHTERPDVTFEGVLTVADPGAFSRVLARGLGRHRAFGFGMILLRPAAPHHA